MSKREKKESSEEMSCAYINCSGGGIDGLEVS